jgi:uncharacterized protein
MQKIVIDTNVIVSALIQKSYPYLIIHELFLDDKIELCVSDDLMKEYYEVLSRPKFERFYDFFYRAESLLLEIESKSTKYNPKIKLNLITDVDDNMILELADESFADFIITGNSTDFIFSNYKETKIVNPKEYWENHKIK